MHQPLPILQPGADQDVPTPSHEPIEAIAQQLDELVHAFEEHSDPQVRRAVFRLLERVDALHRIALNRLITVLQAGTAEPGFARAAADPAVRLLLELYNLLPGRDPVPVEVALDQVRPTLAAYGMAVRLVGVTEGVVRLRISGRPRGLHHQHVPVRAMVEAILREHFPALVGIEVEDTTIPPPPNFIPLEALGVPLAPSQLEWHAAGTLAELPAGTMKRVVAAGRWLLLCSTGGEVYALLDACPGSMLPLGMGQLLGAELRCRWHGCRFDIPSGRRVGGDGPDLALLPVRLVDGVVEVGLTMRKE